MKHRFRAWSRSSALKQKMKKQIFAIIVSKRAHNSGKGCYTATSLFCNGLNGSAFDALNAPNALNASLSRQGSDNVVQRPHTNYSSFIRWMGILQTWAKAHRLESSVICWPYNKNAVILPL